MLTKNKDRANLGKDSMANATLRIKQVTDISTDQIEANGVFFSVIQGEPSTEQVQTYFHNQPTSLWNIKYSAETKDGYFSDHDLSFKENQELIVDLDLITEPDWEQ